ncbi:hypothetical protein L5515_017544 [Caenorhabditis briggsae]|uniref:Uncharacterized protein n=1 Tax=Caenorhabditis briggsae TaxID=6238 RepID=A0AAE9JRP7_CAEBR|nr:hypothetical protein L5515_017544 [Caenorhabditis briggsae]
MNIPRTFRSNPIPAIFGKYCYHITDVFIEILRHLIFIRGLFQLMMKRLGKLFSGTPRKSERLPSTIPGNVKRIQEESEGGAQEIGNRVNVAIEKCILAHNKSDMRSFFHKFNSCQKMYFACAICAQKKGAVANAAVERAGHVAVEPRHEIQAATKTEDANEATQAVSVNAPVSSMFIDMSALFNPGHFNGNSHGLAEALPPPPVNAQLPGVLSRAIFQHAKADEQRPLAMAREWYGDRQDVLQLVHDSTAALKEAVAIAADDRAQQKKENNDVAQYERPILEHAKADEQKSLAMAREWYGDHQDVLQLVQDSTAALEKAEVIEADDRAQQVGNGNNDVARCNPCERCIRESIREALEMLEHENADERKSSADEGTQQAQQQEANETNY